MTRRAPCFCALLILVVSCGSRTEPPATGSQPGPEPAASVVQVIGELCRRDAQGSGVLLADGLVLTSAHVIAGSEGGLGVRRPEGDPVPASLVAFDPNRDLALLTTSGLDGEPVVLAAATDATAGVIGTVDVDGHLELLEYSVERLIPASSGDIYDEGEVVRAALQLRAATLPGDSGGAVFDSTNRVVGIVFAQSTEEDSVAYAVTAAEIEAFLAEVDTSTEVTAGRCP